MPNLKTAKKNLRKTKKRTALNKQYKNKIDYLIRKIKKGVKEGAKNLQELLKNLYKAVDKAAKEKVIHKNKASRIKSKMAKLIKNKK
jgi:small subunit ribosomal protein S20